MEKPAMTQVTAGCKPLTTFVQTDTNSFREVVQRLTGPTEPNNSEPINSTNLMGLKRPKLHERRQCTRPKLDIVKPSFNLRQLDQISPSKMGSGPSHLTSPLGTPSTIMSNLSINEGTERVLNSEEEEKAIKERRFYLHPSPTMDCTEPQLLALFPLKSPNTE